MMYQCPWCYLTTKTADGLRRHMERPHTVQCYYPDCQAVCIKRMTGGGGGGVLDLTKHVRTIHGPEHVRKPWARAHADKADRRARLDAQTGRLVAQIIRRAQAGHDDKRLYSARLRLLKTRHQRYQLAGGQHAKDHQPVSAEL